MMQKSLLANITVNIIVFICALIGVLATFFGVSGLMTGTSILYYTIQSNIWIGLTSLAFAMMQIISLRKKIFKIPDWLYVIKYVFVVAITLTMVVFWLLLAPTIRLPSYLVSPSNLFAHTLTPIMAIVSFLLFDSRSHKLKKKTSLFSLATPIYYFLFAFISSLSGVNFHLYKMPYFFLDFYEFGWFSHATYSNLYTFSSFGIFYWIIIILIFIFLMGYGYMFLSRFLYQQAHSKMSILEVSAK
ncbi:MAG: hypothetical protein WC931_05810 [Bacilli bacterium]|jgi:hypothetical protein